MQYSITFVGPHFSNGRQDKLQFLQSDCDIIYPENFSSSLNTIVEGVTRFTPYIISIETNAEGIVHGDFLISFGYGGLYNQLVVIENSTAFFKVDAGESVVSTNEYDFTNHIIPGEILQIRGELSKVKEVRKGYLKLEKYHKVGTGGSYVPAYRIETFVGIALFSYGDKYVREIHGKNLNRWLKANDQIKVHDVWNYYFILNVENVTDDNFNLTSSYMGTAIIAPIYIRKRIRLSTDSSSHEFKSAIESLEGPGTVSVQRFGPGRSLGYKWIVTFTSNISPLNNLGSHLMVDTSVPSILQISSDINICDGSYIFSKFEVGKPSYNLPGSLHIILNLKKLMKNGYLQ